MLIKYQNEIRELRNKINDAEKCLENENVDEAVKQFIFTKIQIKISINNILWKNQDWHLWK